MKTSQANRIGRWIHALLYGIIITVIMGGCEYILPNKPPFVEKLTPADSMLFSVGSVVPFTVNAYDLDGTIDRVIFKAPGSDDFADSVIPYEYNWLTAGLTAGLYQVTITALDNDGEPYSIEVPVRLITGTTTNAGRDTTITSSVTQYTLQADSPGTSTGTWSILSGEGGQLSDIHQPNAVLSGLPCHSYTLRWSVVNLTSTVSDEVVITFMHQPSPALAGDDQTLTDGSVTATLGANTPAQGTGMWMLVSGGYGSFSDVHQANSTFTGQLCHTYTLRWTISTECATVYDEMILTLDQVVIQSEAGPDQKLLNGTVSTILQANAPAEGVTGTWSILFGSGGSFSNIYDPAAAFTGEIGQIYRLAWSFTGSCSGNSDEVLIAIPGSDTCSDPRDAKTYEAVVIGNHVWMAENLNYNAAGSYAYDNNPDHALIFGRLYDWSSAQAACPSGWHLPSDDEFRDLEKTLGIDDAVTLLAWYRGTSEGGMLKEDGTAHWVAPNTGASNLSGFTALPGGYRTASGSYEGITHNTGYWTSTDDGANSALYRALTSEKAQIGRDWSAKDISFSVRCVKN